MEQKRAHPYAPLFPAKAEIRLLLSAAGFMTFYVYILASRRNGTLYIGHTDSISRRVWQHKTHEIGFTANAR